MVKLLNVNRSGENMKIVTPEVQIDNKTGFEPSIDIFERKEFGERLAKLIENSESNPVIALDAGWGQGKSTFIKMWRGYLSHQREKKIQSVYFDAFENDYQKDPFLALASEMYQLISNTDEEKQTQFKDKAIKAGRSLARGAIKLTVRTVTAGVIDGSAVDAVEKDLSNLIADQVDDLVKERFEHAQKDKLALKAFKEHLSTFATEQGDGGPIVFIIDELDRCRPDFALELLEQVKHLFSVKGITFILVTNRVQLEQSIKAKYGESNPVNYLHKFINVWLTLPRATDQYNDHGYRYLQYVLREMSGENRNTNLRECENVLVEVVQYYQPSFREIERILSYFSILSNMLTKEQLNSEYQSVIAIVCYLKVCKPDSLRPVDGKISYDRIVAAANFTDIQQTEFCELDRVVRVVNFDFGDKATQEKMIMDKEISNYNLFGREPPNRLLIVNQWLTNISL